MKKEFKQSVCNEEVFKRLYIKYAKSLHDFLYYKYGELLNPKDKTQEAFIKLWDNCRSVEPGKAKSFLFKVANNMMLNEIKHQKVVLRYQKQIKRNEYDDDPTDALNEKEQFLKHYQNVLENLKEEQRVAFLLNKVEGKKHSEIAEILGITQKTVEYRIYSAFNILKKELERFKNIQDK